jgi:methyl-accepting chemotaxis protein
MLVGEVFARMGLDSKQYEKSLDRLENVTKKRALTLGNIFKGAFSFTLGMGLFQGLQAGTGMLKDFIITAMQTETYEVAMEAVARATGTSTDALKQQKKAVMDLGVAGQEATQVLTRFMQSQLDIRYATKLTRVAQDAATIAGENSSDATKQITEAIAKLRPELLSQYGMTRNLNDIYNDYGKTVGKKANQLSEVEKKQAMLNYVLREGEKIAGSYEAAMGTVGKQLGSMEKLMLPKKLMQEFQTELAGPLIMPAFSVLVDNIIAGIEKMKVWVVDNKEMLRAWGETIKQIVQGVWKTFSGFFGFLLDNAGVLVPLIGTLFKFAFSYLVATTAINLARKATELFSLATLAVKGSLKDGPALFRFISQAVGIYRLQLRLAAMEGITVTGVMAKLRIALYSLKTALGPIGLISIALSLLVAAGIWVYQNWEKVKHYGLQAWGALKVGIGYYVMGIIKLYKLLLGWIPGLGKVFDNLLSKVSSFVSREKSIMASRKSTYADANKPVNEMTKKQQELLNAAQDSMGAINDQGDAIKDAGKKTKKAGKEAKGGLASFDEIHQVMQQTADAADDAAAGVGDIGGIGDLGNIGGLGDIGDLGGIGDEGLGGLLPEISDTTDRIKGLWGKWEDWVQSWDWVQKLSDWLVDTFYDETTGKWGLQKVWGKWEDWVQSWDWVQKLSDWLVDTFYDETTGKWGLQKVWGKWEDWVQSWDWVDAFSFWIVDWFYNETSGKWGLQKVWGRWSDWVQSWDWVDAFSFWIVDWFYNETSGKWGLQKVWGKWEDWVQSWDWVDAFSRWIVDWFYNETTGKWGLQKVWSNWSNWVNSWTWTQKLSNWLSNFWVDPKKKWNDAVNWIKAKVGSLKNAFNFQWSLPSIKLPHFYVTWSTSGFWGKVGDFLGLPGKPILGVNWYAEGGIFSQPSIIGVGEAGAEAVVPLDRLTELFASALRQVLSEARPTVAGGSGDITIPVYIGNELLETIIVKAQDRQNTRSNGRI